MIGSEEFRRELPAAASQGVGPTDCGGHRHETELAKADRVLKAEPKRLGRKQGGLLPKGHPVKVQLARHLREQTTLSLRWIASHLHSGRWTYLSNLVAAPAKAPGSCQNALPRFQR